MISIIKSLLPLFVVQFFTWLALFSLWIYSTPVITRYIFHSTDSESPAFENGVTWVGICFAFYSTLAAFLAFFIPNLLKHTTKQRLHSIALLIGSIGLGLIGFINTLAAPAIFTPVPEFNFKPFLQVRERHSTCHAPPNIGDIPLHVLHCVFLI